MRSCLSLPLFAGTFCVLASLDARAEPSSPSVPEQSTVERSATTRSEIVLGVIEPFDADLRATLVRLLRAELEPLGLVLVERDPSGEPRAWARDVANDERRLLAALLDTRSRSGWRLVLIDTARGRAISRELPGGERDAANVEAIVSIVVSATNALREGLEVASAPLETVVEPARAPAPSPPPPPSREAPKRDVETGTSLHGAVGAIATSFADAAEPTLGGSLLLGASIASLIDVDLGGAYLFPVNVSNEFGSFSLERTSLSLTAGPVFRMRSFTFVPALGPTSEWIERRETLASEGVTLGNETRTIHRWGGVLALRGRYRVLSSGAAELVSLTGALGAAYFGERVRFLAGADTMTEARRTVFGGELGLFFATDRL